MCRTEIQAAKAAFPDSTWSLDLPDADRELVENVESYFEKSVVTKYEFKMAMALTKKRDTVEAQKLLKERFLRYTSMLAAAVQKPWEKVVFEAFGDHIKRLLKDLDAVGKKGGAKEPKEKGDDKKDPKDKKKDKKEKQKQKEKEKQKAEKQKAKKQK